MTTAQGPERPVEQMEFGPDENALFADLSSKMHFVGMFFTVVGLLAIVVGVITLLSRDTSPGLLALMFTGVLHIAVGVWTRGAGREFRAIVETRGADRTHLFGALQNLRKFYALMYWMAVASIGMLLVSLIFAILSNGSAVRPVA